MSCHAHFSPKTSRCGKWLFSLLQSINIDAEKHRFWYPDRNKIPIAPSKTQHPEVIHYGMQQQKRQRQGSSTRDREDRRRKSRYKEKRQELILPDSSALKPFSFHLLLFFANHYFAKRHYTLLRIMTPRQILLFIIGCAAVVLGAIGIVLPVLPTTPFIIAAALCFSASSPKMYAWLSSSKYFGEYIANYREGTGVSRKTKAYSLIFLWALLLLSSYFMRNNILIVAILMIVGICVTAHILLLKGQAKTSEQMSDA